MPKQTKLPIGKDRPKLPPNIQFEPPPPPPSYPVTILVHTDATGIIAQTTCPNCGRTVRIAQHGRQPGQRCGCGCVWELTIAARPVVGPSEVKG